MVYFIHLKNMDDFDNWQGSPGTGHTADENGEHDHEHDHDHGEAEIEPTDDD